MSRRDASFLVFDSCELDGFVAPLKMMIARSTKQRLCTSKGIAFFRYDKRGSGARQGEHMGTGFFLRTDMNPGMPSIKTNKVQVKQPVDARLLEIVSAWLIRQVAV
jgi:hypothetical protein